MKSLRFLCLLAALLAMAPSLRASPPAGYYLVWADEFNGTSLDTTKWDYWLAGPRRDAVNVSSAVSVGGGQLTITTYTSNNTHYTGMIATDGKFRTKYGYWEASIDWNDSPGMWSAYWMQSPTMGKYLTDPVTSGSEIDCAEHRYIDGSSNNIANQVQVNIHWDGYGSAARSAGSGNTGSGLNTGFHTYGFQWTANSYNFSIDGTSKWTGGNSPVSQSTEWMILSSEVQNGSWAGNIPAGGYGGLTTSTTKMTVDYVRYYAPTNTLFWLGSASAFWTNSANWVSNTAPVTASDLTFSYLSSGNLSNYLGANLSVDSLTVLETTSPFSVNGADLLTLGAGGVDMISLSQNASFNCPIQLGAAQTWTIGSGRILSVNDGITGSAALTLAGMGTVALGGAATYSGDTTISSGATLQMGAANVLPNGAGAGNLIVNGTLDLKGTTQSLNALTGAGTVDNTAGSSATLTIGNNDAGGTFSGTIQDTGGALALIKNGTGGLTLTGSNTFSGGFINNGAGSVNSGNPAGTNYCFGSGPVAVNAGTLYFTAASWTFTNALILNGGTLRVGGGSGKSLTWAGPVSVTADSALHADGSTSGLNLTGGLDMGGGGYTLTASADGGATAPDIAGPISGATGTLAVTGSSTQLNLDGTNIFGGTFRAVSGTLSLRNIYAAQNATLDYNAADSGTINYNGLSLIIGALTGSRSFGLSANPLIGNNNTDTTYSGVISGSGSVTKIGTGTLTFAGANTYTGDTIINRGKLALSGSGSIASTNIIVAGGATLDTSGMSASFVLGSRRILSNSSAGAVLNGSSDCTAGTLSLVSDGVNSSFILTNGTLSLSPGTVVRVNNTGPVLAGSRTIIAASTAGNTGQVTGPLPPVVVTGNGAVGPVSLRINNHGGLDLVAMANNATNLNYSLSGAALTLTWPADHLGWYAQSNSVRLSSGADWHDLPGSESGTNVVITIDPAKPRVFYRLSNTSQP